MIKKLLSAILISVLFISFLAFPSFAKNDISEQVCITDFKFENQLGEDVSSPVPGELIQAKGFLKRCEGFNEDIPFTFSVIGYQDGKTVFFEYTTGILLKTQKETEIATPSVTLPESVKGLKIWAVITTEDYSEVLASQANMGSSECAIERINIAGYDLPIVEGKYEYDVTLYLKADKFPIETLVWTKDLSSTVEIEDITANDTTYTITSSSGDRSQSETYTINLKAYEMNETSLRGLSYKYTYNNGIEDVAVEKALESFTPDNESFIIDIESEEDVIPELLPVTFDSSSRVEVTSPESFPGVGEIKVIAENGTEKSYPVITRKVFTENIPLLDSYLQFGNYANVEGRKQQYVRLMANREILETTPNNGSTVGYMLFRSQHRYIPGINTEIGAVTFNIAKLANASGIPGRIKLYNVNYALSDLSPYIDTENQMLIDNSFKPYKGMKDSTDENLIAVSESLTVANQKYHLNADHSKFVMPEDGYFVIAAKRIYDGNTNAIWIYPESLSVKYILTLE